MGYEGILKTLPFFLIAFKSTSEKMKILIFLSSLVIICGVPLKHDNIWIRLADITGSDNICLQQDVHIGAILGSCLLPVCHPAEEIKNLTFFSQFPSKTVSYADSYNWGTPSYKLPKDIIQLMTPHVAVSKNDTCAVIKNCTTKCKKLGNGLHCNKTQKISYGTGHILLPEGWFFSCGNFTFNYIPANISDGTHCCLSRLTVFLPSPEMLDYKNTTRNRHKSQSLHQLDPSCDDAVNLLSKEEVDALAFSLVGVPGLALGAYNTVTKLACTMVKNINSTSTALSLLNEEQQVLQQGILDNRAAIDYLLLLHHKKCNQVKNMCCFNLTDNSHSIAVEIQKLTELASHFTQDKGSESLFNWLTSWLPNFSWLKELFVGIVIFLIHLLTAGLVGRCFVYFLTRHWNSLRR
ncbi:syncytin-2 isoform X2 [Oryctolagus cuniculus]|uniref:syncytin-2 isoform X2 n=1 Tax=Oryctolagus cuniculus TaxID=9986 RepID=UPI0038794AF0